MRNGCRFVRSLLIAAALVLPVTIGGCVHRTYRVYDPVYADYHVWNGNEVVVYRRWLVETHRPYRDFRRLRPAEQREYWTWRHSHPS